jgi:hypothetical protein
MKKSKKAKPGSRRNTGTRRRRVLGDIDDASRAEVIREFDRAEPIPPTKEIHLMSKEEREILVRPSTN